MEMHEGGTFAYWGGSICGVNLDMNAHGLLQQWKERNWEGYSLVEYSWEAQGSSVVLKMIQTHIPGDYKARLELGWNAYFFTPLKTYLERERIKII